MIIDTTGMAVANRPHRCCTPMWTAVSVSFVGGAYVFKKPAPLCKSAAFVSRPPAGWHPLVARPSFVSRRLSCNSLLFVYGSFCL